MTYKYYNCDRLKSIIIPQSVATIEGNVFSSCDELASIIVEKGNIIYDSRENSNAIIKTNTNELIAGCMNSQIPNTVTSIGGEAFYGYSGLTSITIPNSVTSIGYMAFGYCEELKTITIPVSVKEIEAMAFFNCTKLESLYLYGTTTLGIAFYGIPKSCIIYAHLQDVPTIRQEFKGTILPIDEYTIETTAVYCKGLDFIVKKNGVPIEAEQEDLEFSASYTALHDGLQTWGNSEVQTLGNGHYCIRGLLPSSTCRISIYSPAYGKDITALSVTTNSQDVGIIEPSQITTTQTTITLEGINATEDITTGKIIRYGIDVKECQHSHLGKGDTYETLFSWDIPENGSTTITGLRPGKDYYFQSFAEYEDGTIAYNNSTNYEARAWTKDIEFDIDIIEETATGFTCRASYDVGDAHLISAGYTNYTSGNGIIHTTGLEPDNSYEIEYAIETQEGGVRKTSVMAITQELEFSSLNPKVIRQGEAIVAAETNITEDEEIGFEWRKTDAPETVPSKQGMAVIYDGMMEGLIKNLSENSYYNVRPYYKAASGKMYYGDWIGIDPSDFSYFEPTVHTYANVEVIEGQATLTGYVMTGSDDILEQGFEYWAVSAKAKGFGEVTASGNVQTVVATGQRMTATISGLQSETTYKYRAYVKTASGTTYGEEQEFTTPATDGIETVEAQSAAGGRSVQGIYTLQGVKVSDDAGALRLLPRGVYIVNGKKVAVK